jgi:hypothetical protein
LPRLTPGHPALEHPRFRSARLLEFIRNSIVKILNQALQVVGINTTVSSLGEQIDRDRVENELVCISSVRSGLFRRAASRHS